MTQRDDMGRVLGVGFRVGNSYTPVADSCQCRAKPIQYCKVKKSNKFLKKEKKKNWVSNSAVSEVGLIRRNCFLDMFCSCVVKLPSQEQSSLTISSCLLLKSHVGLKILCPTLVKWSTQISHTRKMFQANGIILLLLQRYVSYYFLSYLLTVIY